MNEAIHPEKPGTEILGPEARKERAVTIQNFGRETYHKGVDNQTRYQIQVEQIQGAIDEIETHKQAEYDAVCQFPL